MEAAPFCGPVIITTTPSPPVLFSRTFNFLIFSIPCCSFEAIVTVRYNCSISRSADRSLPGGRRLQTIRAYTPGIPSIETEGSEGAQGISSSFWSSFIPAFLLDNEHPSYRKQRAAYGCQNLLLRLTSLAILPRDTIITKAIVNRQPAILFSNFDDQIGFWSMMKKLTPLIDPLIH